MTFLWSIRKNICVKYSNIQKRKMKSPVFNCVVVVTV